MLQWINFQCKVSELGPRPCGSAPPPLSVGTMLYRARGKGNWLTRVFSSRRVQPWKRKAGQAEALLGPLAAWTAQPVTGLPQGRPDAQCLTPADTELASLGDLAKFPWGAGPPLFCWWWRVWHPPTPSPLGSGLPLLFNIPGHLLEVGICCV